MNCGFKPWTLFAFAAVSVLTACARLDQPRDGAYRGSVELPGGELPFFLVIEHPSGAVQLSVLHTGGKQPASQVVVQNSKLNAELPDGAGTIDAAMSRKGLSGTLTLNGKTLPFKAVLGAGYRFFKESATDNADVSGHWQLQCQGADAPSEFDLTQSHDQVDGSARLPNGMAVLIEGQAHGDDLSLGALGAGIALLYKARVDAAGQLQGELWLGETQQHCSAMLEKPAAEP